MKLDTTRRQKLEFDVEVKGIELTDLNPRLILKDSGMSFLVDGRVVGSNLVFDVPALFNKSALPIFDGEVEVVAQGRLFTVWQGQFEVVQPPEIKLSDGVVKESQTIKAVPVAPSVKTRKTQPWIRKLN